MEKVWIASFVLAAVFASFSAAAEETKPGPVFRSPPVPRVVRDGASVGRAVVITDAADLLERREDEFIGSVCGKKLRDWRVYYRRVIETGGHLYHETTVLLSPSFKRRIFYFDVTAPLAPVPKAAEKTGQAKGLGSVII